jgi:hypothetical protein
MAYDADTLCETLKSPFAWAETAAMPEARRHFQDIAYSLEQTKPAAAATTSGPLQALDMARCASELNM